MQAAPTTLLSEPSQAVGRTPVSLTPDIRPTDFALFHTSPRFSETLLIDLTRSNSVLHSIHSGACSPSDGNRCNCIHYGYCSPVSGNAVLNNDHRRLPRTISNDRETIASKRVSNPSNYLSVSSPRSGDLPDRLHRSSAFDLIANDEESYDLQHLLNRFIWHEKMKQQNLNSQTMSNKHLVNLRPVNNRLSQSMSSLNTIPGRQSQKISPSDLYIRGRSSQSHKLLSNAPGQAAPLAQKRPHPFQNNQTQPLIGTSNFQSQLDQNPPISNEGCKSVIGDSAVGQKELSAISARNDSGRRDGALNQDPSIPYPADKPNTKRIFGLSDKTNKNKYLRLASDRQAPNSGATHGLETSPPVTNAPKTVLKETKDAPHSPKILSNSETVGRLLEERFTDQLMQLTDDEKVQYIIASHTRQQAGDKHTSLPSPNGTSSSDQVLEKHQVKPKLKQTPKDNLIQPKSHPAPNTNLSKYRSLSCDSLASKQLIDFKSYQGPQMIDYSSPFDYAKTRFINSFILSGLKIPDNNKLLTPSQNLVSETKNKLLGKNVVPLKQMPDNGDSKPGFRRNTIDANVMKIPVRNPVKPYLSRGSVAERVLLFEKCPEMLAQRKSLVQTTRRSKSPVLYRHWKNTAKVIVTARFLIRLWNGVPVA